MSGPHFDERGREYEPFLPLLNWQCLTSATDTRGEQSVLRHTSRTVQETWGICRGHESLIFLSYTEMLMKLKSTTDLACFKHDLTQQIVKQLGKQPKVPFV